MADQGDPREGDDRAPAIRLEGKVSNTVFHSVETRYTVLRVYVRGSLEPTTWVGRSMGVEEGAQVSAMGEWVMHPVHGRQFAFERLTVKAPTTLPGIRRRLEKYPGLGKDKAEKIVRRFAADTFTILDNEPRRLLEVEGIGPKTLDRIIEHHSSRSGPVVEVENQLIELDLPTYYADAIVRRFAGDALTVLQRHPYRLAREVRGIGFLTADRIARALGVDMESDDRVDAGLVYVLEQAESDGHCALPRDRLINAAVGILTLPSGRERDPEASVHSDRIPPARIEAGIDRLLMSAELVEEAREGGAPLLFLAELHAAEHNVAQVLADLATTTAHERWSPGALPEHLSPGQVAAVKAIAESGLVILTGGPGTGKSTVIRQVIEMALAHECELMLAAPTGRAAKRLSEATGQEARTIHRLLEIQGSSGAFTYHTNNPLPGPALVVIDEASMLDVTLADALFSALTPEHRLMLVGDIDQLPSVGPGNVLRDVIAAAERPGSPIPVVRLKQIFRQAEGSSIIVNAHTILEGSRLRPDSGGDGQFFVVHAREAERAHELVMKAVCERAPEAYGLDPRADVQILCPMHKGKAGTSAFNQALQERFTKGQPEVVLDGSGRSQVRRFRLGDRVMQTRNDYDRQVFNGDIGQVVRVNPEKQSLVVEIDGIPVAYETKQLAALQLAYAVTIHKSQGSEFPAVIIPLLGEHWVMLRRNLLYTAVTRAQRLCVLVGDPRAIGQAIRRADAARRFTGLAPRLVTSLREALGEMEIVAIDST
ncbi:MAG: ATP-dependent RecD-like DNA helicase [Nannocystaceae bacterium]